MLVIVIGVVVSALVIFVYSTVYFLGGVFDDIYKLPVEFV